MENASKALLIAAGSLIAILLLTLFAYGYAKINGSASNLYSMMEEAKISEFNQKFLNYSGLSDIKIQDIVSVINLAEDAKKNGFIIYVYIDWNIKGVDNIEDLLKSDVDNTKYKCDSISIDPKTRIVNQIKFIKNP